MRPTAHTPIRCGLLAFAAALLVLTTPRATFGETPAVHFSRDVLPILSDKCFHCHGPDEQARKGRLRLDTQEGAFGKKGVLVPGQSDESELIYRILTEDPDDLMPPPDSNRSLTADQIATLRRWVDEGAEWGQHWAFETVRDPKLPTVRNSSWPRNPIDAFVLERLEEADLSPSPQARRETLLRRVALDLTGLPPSAEEVRVFVEDESADAYERAVDRLLASRAYGERLASDWLDLARYADTHGFQMDRHRSMWPYRDWVIKAFNENLPFDQFVTWQIAGDLLPDATREQRLATAFNRLHLQNEEGGIVEEEYRVAYVVDRVNTFGTAFLGLTLDCSRCHDHKYDPITMRDYYGLFSFFQNIDESGQTTFFTSAMPVPTLLLSDDATDAKLAGLREQIGARERQQPALREQARVVFDQWLRERTRPESGREALELPGLIASFHFDTITSNKVDNAANLARPGNAVEAPELVPGRAGQAARLNGENGFTFPGLGHFTRADPFSIGIWLQPPPLSERAVILHHSRAPIDAGSRGYELLLENGRLSLGLHHMWPGNSLKVTTRNPLPSGEWVHVTAVYDGSSRAAGIQLYINGALAEHEVIRDGLYKDITYEGGEPDLALGFRFRDSGFKDGLVDDFQLFARALTPIEVAHLAGGSEFYEALSASELSGSALEQLLAYYTANLYPPAARFQAELRELRLQHHKIVNAIPEVMVMQELPEPKPAYLLTRGEYDARGEAVMAGTPAVLPAFPENQPRNRLGLARWLVAEENPLMARVTVNRAWQMMFGNGIVETVDNFGFQGDYPSHPELLDWLAREFIRSGWDLKKLLKLMATSATYQQSSETSADLLALDPANRWLARGPGRRLTAEMLRDQALSLSGLLVEKIGGPSVKPYQPEGLWEEIAMGRPRYDQGKGEDLYRRSLYTYWKRTVPHPVMITFDAAERNVCIVRRQQTSTPLQALALLNDPQIVEAARFLSQEMLRHESRDLTGRVAWLFQRILAREPSSRETPVLRALFLEQREIFAAAPDEAALLMTVGDGVNDPRLDLLDLAAGTVLAKALLNHDEAIMRR